MTETVVRLATDADRPRVFELCRMLHEENGLFPLSLKKLDQLLDRTFQKQGGIIGVIGPAGAPDAAICLCIDQMYYSDTWFLNEAFTFVHPEHRTSDYARKLIDYAKACSDRLAMPLMVGILSNHRTAAKQHLYERRLEKAGAYFVHNRQFSGAGAWDHQGE